MPTASVDSVRTGDFERAEGLYRAGKYQEALTVYRQLVRQSLEQRLAGERAWDLADLMIIERLAELCTLFGHFEAAELLLDAGAAVNRRAGDSYGADYMAVKRLQVFLAQGRLNDASAQLASLAPGLVEGNRLALAPQHLARWEEKRRWPQADDDDRQVLFAGLYWSAGRVVSSDGQYADAVALYERGLVHTDVVAPHLARQTALPLRLDLAGALLEKGELAQAEWQLAALETDIFHQGNPGLRVRWLERCGQLDLLRGALGTAFDRFAQVRRHCLEHAFNHAARTASLNLAQVLILLNQTVEAEDLALEVKTEAADVGDDAVLARASFLHALTLSRRQALDSEDSGPLSVAEMRHQGQQGVSLDVPEGRPLDLPPASNYLTFFEERSLAAHQYLRLGRLDDAAQILTQMDVLFAGTDSVLVATRLDVLRGLLDYYVGRYAAAERRFRAAAERQEAMALRPELWQTQRCLGWCRVRAGDDKEASLWRRRAQDLLDAMAESLPEELQAMFLINKWTAAEEQLVGELDALALLKIAAHNGSRLSRPFRHLAIMRRLDVVLERLDDHRPSVTESLPDGLEDLFLTEASLGDESQRSGGDPVPGTVAGAATRLFNAFFRWGMRGLRAMLAKIDAWERARLARTGADSAAVPIGRRSGTYAALLRRLLQYPRQRANLAFVSLPDRMLILRTTWLRLDFAVSPLTRLDLRHLVRRWHQAVAWAGEGRNLSPEDLDQEVETLDKTWRSIEEELGRALGLPPILERLPSQVEALTIVPDDALHGFPFAVLHHRNQPLGALYRLAVDHHLIPKRAHRRGEGNGRALLVGVARGAPGIRPLPGVKDEIAAIELWARARSLATEPGPLLDERASRGEVLTHLPSAELLHIACHGVFRPARPDRTGLVLVPRPDSHELLSLKDLAGISLLGLQHATLSCCWAADNFVLPGRLVLSLPEVLRRRGAGSVLACLWPIDDRVAAAFMERFYAHLDRHPRDEALRLVRVQCRDNKLGVDGVDTSNPYFWSGFNLHGDTGHLFIGA